MLAILKRLWFLLLMSLVTANSSGDDFPLLPNTEPSTVRPMPAEEAAATMQLPPGFHATLFAAEPDVQNPIAMAWDERGRLWIAENYTYAERTQRFDLSLRDRVLVFHDKDGDGRSDSRIVFTDNVQMLTSVEVGHGGVWLMCPPQLLFIPDANQDDIPDGPAQVVLDGFDVAQDNYHNFANGLRWGPDGWLYGRCGHSCPGNIGLPGTPDDHRVPLDGGIWRFHPDRKVVEVLCYGTTNPWGHDWDANGELFFINTVIGHLWHMVPGSHFQESFGESSNAGVYERMNMIADHYHFDTKGGWGESRNGKANEFGGGHAHVGMMIYLGATWPQRYHGKLMTINMHGMRVNVDRLEQTRTGYVGKHEPDLLISSDPFFRGTDLSVGPDGNVYLIDWSDTGECHEHTGVHRQSGRIFQIAADTAGGSGGGEKAPFAKPMCLLGDGKLPRLWHAYQQGQTTTSGLRELLSDPDEHVRVWAIRLLTDFWPLDRVKGPSPYAVYPEDAKTQELLIGMARNDPSGLVARVLASTLQRLPTAVRPRLATELVHRNEYRDEHELALLTWFGLIPLGDSQPESLVSLASASTWPTLSQMIARHVATRIKSDPPTLAALIAVAEHVSKPCQTAMVRGIHEGLRGMRKGPMPAGWDQFRKLPGVREEPAMVRDLSTLFGDGRALAEVYQIAIDARADIKTRQSALQTLIDTRPENLRATCESLLDVRVLNATAVQGLVLWDDPEIALLLAKNYRRFDPLDRPMVIESLVSRKKFAAALLDSFDKGSSQIPLTDITAAHARQIQSHGDAKLTEQLSRIWGEQRESSTERRATIESWKQQLTPNSRNTADLSHGRALFQKTCAACHVLYGEGHKIGPDLTGSQRSSLDYLLENIIDPSAVVSKDYRMTIVTTADGRVLNGLVASRDAQRIVLQTATEQVTIAMEDVEEVTQSTLSAMPDGLLQNLTSEQVLDLIAYLMSPVQVPSP